MFVNFHFNDDRGLRTYRELSGQRDQGGPKWFYPKVSSFNSSVFLCHNSFRSNNLCFIYSAINNQGTPSADTTSSVGCNLSFPTEKLLAFKTYVMLCDPQMIIFYVVVLQLLIIPCFPIYSIGKLRSRTHRMTWIRLETCWLDIFLSMGHLQVNLLLGYDLVWYDLALSGLPL